MKAISAADANRQFSSVLRTVAGGEEVTVFSRGRPVARISPILADQATRETARQSLLTRLRTQESSGPRTWTRDELYED